MQRQRGAVGSLPEIIVLDDDSSSSDAGADQQLSQNKMPNPEQDWLSDYLLPSTAPELLQNSASQGGPGLSRWSIEESSSSTNNPVILSQQNPERQYKPTNLLSFDGVDVNLGHNHVSGGARFVRSSNSDSVSQDVNASSSFDAHRMIDLRSANAFESVSSDNLRLASATGAADPCSAYSAGSGSLVQETKGRRLSCKRKAFELSGGQSSGNRSSNVFKRPESTLGGGPSEQVTAPRVGLTVGGVPLESPRPLSVSVAGSSGTTNRSHSLRMNHVQHQDLALTDNTPVGPYPYLRYFSLNNSAVDNSSPQGQPAIRVPSSHRSLQLSRRYRGSSSRSSHSPGLVIAENINTGLQEGSNQVNMSESVLEHPNSVLDNSSPEGQPAVRVPSSQRSLQLPRRYRSSSVRSSHSPGLMIAENRTPGLHEGSNQVNMAESVPERPIFVPASRTPYSAPHRHSQRLAGMNASSAGNVVPTSQTGSSSGVDPSSAPNLLHQRISQHSRRLSELRHLWSADLQASGIANNGFASASVDSASLRQAHSYAIGNQGHHYSSFRSSVLTDRHDGDLQLQNAMRSLSEIRIFLDNMRRGESGRFEDVVGLDRSVLYGLANIRDRHRDMRLDIDNMSYEELLALEERIGDVKTGLSEEAILNRLKQRKFFSFASGPLETEPCSICQDEYANGDDIGALDCGHDFHTHCIKQWLALKNLCPICKSTALAT